MDETDWEEEEKWEGRNTKFFIPLSLQEGGGGKEGGIAFRGKSICLSSHVVSTTEFHACREKRGGRGTHRLG